MGRMSQQQKPEKQTVPAELHSENQVHRISPEGTLGSRQGHYEMDVGDGRHGGSELLII